MYHSITFQEDDDEKSLGGVNTWDDFKLIPTERPIFSLPEPNLTYIDIPGYGRLDTTDTLTGYTTFKNREGSFEFMLAHKDIFEDGYDNHDPAAIYQRINDILQFIQGRRLRAILEDDPEWYYVGHFYASEIDQEEGWSTIEIEYDVEPYKINILEQTKTFELYSTPREEHLLGYEVGCKPVCPTFKIGLENSATIVFTNNELGILEEEVHMSSIDAITKKFPEIVLSGFNDLNQNKMTISGVGKLTVSYRVGGF